MGGDQISFSVPGAPIGKGRPKARNIRGRPVIYTDPKAERYMEKVRAGARVAMAGRAPWLGPVGVWLVAYVPVPESASKRRKARLISGEESFYGTYDADNLLKSVLDGMNKVVFQDDRQVMMVTAKKIPAETGSINVVVAKL